MCRNKTNRHASEPYPVGKKSLGLFAFFFHVFYWPGRIAVRWDSLNSFWLGRAWRRRQSFLAAWLRVGGILAGCCCPFIPISHHHIPARESSWWPTYLLGGTSSGDFPRLVFRWGFWWCLFSSSFFLGSFVFIDLPFLWWWLWLFCEMWGLCVYM